MNPTAVKAFLQGAMQENPTDEQIEELVAFLLRHSSKPWYRYICQNPGCGSKIFSTEHVTQCFCAELEEGRK